MREIFWRIVDSRWSLTAFFVGTALALLGLSSPLWPTGPEITAGPPASELFKQSFRIKNPSRFFAVTNFVLRCAPEVTTRSRAGIKDIGFTMFENGRLGPEESATYTCPIPVRFMDGDPIFAGSMTILAEYDSINPMRQRVRDDVVFTLDANATPPQWVQGRRLR